MALIEFILRIQSLPGTVRQSQGQQNNWYPSTRHAITKNSVVSVFGRNSISAMPPPKQNSIRPQILFIACASPFKLLLQSMRRGVQSLIFPGQIFSFLIRFYFSSSFCTASITSSSVTSSGAEDLVNLFTRSGTISKSFVTVS